MKIFTLIGIIISLLINGSNLFASKFIENRGQWANDVKFVYQSDNMNMIIKNSGIYYDLFRIKNKSKSGNVIKLDFDIKNNLLFNGIEQDSEVINIFKGNNPNKWLKNIKTYKSVNIENVFNKIDMRYYFDGKNLRYDMIVRQGGSVDDISLKFLGIDGLEVNETNFILKTQITDLNNKKLFVYQMINGMKKQIDCKFIENNGKVAFDIGEYDKNKVLIIDPVVFSSFAGGSGDDEFNSIALIEENHFVAVGTTNSIDINTTVGAYSTTITGDKDIFLQEYKMNGVYVDILTTTYYGGSDEDLDVDIEVTQNKEIVITGNTRSINLPVMSAFQNQNKGGIDMFFTKFNTDLSEIIVSSYYGGSADDEVRDMTITNNGETYYAGVTLSSDLATSVGAFSQTKNGLSDGFVLGIKVNGLTQLFSTYIGGNAEDELNGVSVDSQNNIYLAGSSKSSDYPVEPTGFGDRPYDGDQNGGWDMVFSKLSAGGSNLLLSSFYGGALDDFGKGIVVDNNSSEYWFVGESEKETGMQTVDISQTASDPSHNGGFDIIAGKFSDLEKVGFWERQRLIFATFLGGSKDERIKSFTINPNSGSLLIMGHTNSKNYPIKGANTGSYEGKNDFFMSEMGKSDGLEYSNLFGSKADDFMGASVIDKNGNIYYAGYTNSDLSSVSNNATDKTFEGSTEAYIGKYTFGVLELNTLAPKLCINNTYNIVWDKRDFSDEDGIKIELIDAENGVYEIATGVMENKYKWKISDDILGGQDYTLRISHKNGLYSVLQSKFEIMESPKIDSIRNNISKGTYCVNDNFSIVIYTSSNQEEPTVQWYKDDKMIDGENSSTLSFENLNIEDSGEYYANVSGFCNPDSQSEIINVEVEKNTNIIDQTSSSTFKEDDTMVLSVVTEGKIIGYEWFKNEELIEGADESEYIINNLMISDAGIYRCLVMGLCGEYKESELMEITILQGNSVADKTDLDNLNITQILYGNDDIKFKINSKYNLNSNITIIDNLGKTVYNASNFDIRSGLNEYMINGIGLSPGVYIMYLRNEKVNAIKKFISY